MTSLESILKNIEKLRKQLLVAAENKGRNHEDSIRISRRLDQLLNNYEKEKQRCSKNKY